MLLGLTMLYVAGIDCIVDYLELIKLVISYFHDNVVYTYSIDQT